jgi:glycosyltransferase involved in cell wall biosynthesis
LNCYNSEAFLKQALDSVFSQTYKNFEIILVDNCSTDRTAEIAKSYDHRLRYVKTKKNIPLYGARNVGLKHVMGEYLCILDSDDYWVSNKLQIQLDKINELANVDILYSAYLSHYETQEDSTLFFKKLYLKLINFSDNNLSEGYVDKNSIIHNYNINFQTIMFKKNVIKDLHFDDRMNLMGDLDFIYRLVWQKNAVIYFMNQVTAYSRIHSRQLSRKSDLKWVNESIQVLKKIKSLMTASEIKEFHRFYIQFYYSSYLLRVHKYKQAVTLKMSYMFVSIRYFLHFIKTIAMIMKG